MSVRVVRRRVGWLLGLAALALVARPAGAFHTVFDFSVDRFEADGNRLGPFDGTPDVVDEFDDLSHWYRVYGTATVRDGRLHVQSPGVHFPGPDGTALDLSNVASAAPAMTIGLGLGNAVATAVFDPIVPPEGHFYHFTLYTYGGADRYFNELFGVDINTSGGVTHIQQHLVELDLPSGTYATVQVESQPVDPAALTSPIHLRVAYDDATATVVSSFSLDDGVTFASPFTPARIFTDGRTTAQFILGADPRLTPATSSTTSTSTTTTTTSNATPTTGTPASTTTSPAPTTSSTTLPLGSCRRTSCAEAERNGIDLRVRGKGQSLAWAWRRGPVMTSEALGDPRGGDGTRYALCVRDAAGTTVFHTELPVGSSCAGRPCWKAVENGGFRFRNDTGLRSLTVTPGGKNGATVVATARGSSLLTAPLPPMLPLTVQLEAETGACWTAVFTSPDVVKAAGARFKAAIE